MAEYNSTISNEDFFRRRKIEEKKTPDALIKPPTPKRDDPGKQVDPNIGLIAELKPKPVSPLYEKPTEMPAGASGCIQVHATINRSTPHPLMNIGGPIHMVPSNPNYTLTGVRFAIGEDRPKDARKGPGAGARLVIIDTLTSSPIPILRNPKFGDYFQPIGSTWYRYYTPGEYSTYWAQQALIDYGPAYGYPGSPNFQNNSFTGIHMTPPGIGYPFAGGTQGSWGPIPYYTGFGGYMNGGDGVNNQVSNIYPDSWMRQSIMEWKEYGSLAGGAQVSVGGGVGISVGSYYGFYLSTTEPYAVYWPPLPGLNTLNQQGVLSIGWCRNTGPGEWILFGFAVEPSGQSLVSGMPSFMPNDFYNSKYVAYNTAQGWPNIYN